MVSSCSVVEAVTLLCAAVDPELVSSMLTHTLVDSSGLLTPKPVLADGRRSLAIFARDFSLWFYSTSTMMLSI
jgi:hypothetical protein